MTRSAAPDPRTRRERPGADARLAAAAEARARKLAALQRRAAHVGAHAAAVAARERARRACDAQRRAAALAAKLATAAQRRAASKPIAGRARARLARARARREACAAATSARPRIRCSVAHPHAVASAVRVLEGVVLLRRARRALNAAQLAPSSLRQLTFAQLAAAVKTRAAQVAAARALRAASVRPTHKSVRTLLAALIIALHPLSAANDTRTVCHARRVAACLYLGSVRALRAAWARWPRDFAAWKKRDRARLEAALVAEAVTTDRLLFLSGVQWREQLEQNQRRIAEAARYIGSQRRVEDARADARAFADDAIVHEMLVDLPGFLAQVANPEKLAPHVWTKLDAQIAAAVPLAQCDALEHVLDALGRALTAMVPASFTTPPMDDVHTHEDRVAFSLIVLERACAALRVAQPQAADDPLSQWQVTAHQRLVQGDTVPMLKELSSLVFTTAARVRELRMRDVAPLITEHGHSWERSRFEQRIASGAIDSTLPHTTRCLMESRTLAHTLPPAYPRVTRALRACIASLIALDRPSPEIFALDNTRITALRHQARCTATIAALVAALRGLGVARPNVQHIRQSINQGATGIDAAASLVIAHPPALATSVLQRATQRPASILLDRVATACAHANEVSANLPVSLRCVQQDVIHIANAVVNLADHAIRVHGTRISALLDTCESQSHR